MRRFRIGRRIAHRALGFTVVAWLVAGPVTSLRCAERPAPEVNVLLWFDTEDYLLPADDDATKRLCEMLTERGIRATFKIVGEKARVLERRGRKDVIAALKRHDIGYHSDFHSVHPTPTEYLADCGWLDGIAEFARREGNGAADVRRIFGAATLSCYGQPGSSWGPQAVAALGQIGVAPGGVPCYVDEGSHVGLDNRPFWYAGALHVFAMGPNLARMELHDPAALEPARKKVSAVAERLSREGGGVISIFYHPCEWVHREFWDGVNFARGANPPREQWKAPAQRSAEETAAAFQRFASYVDHIRGIPGIGWITAAELPALYPDRAHIQGALESDIDQVATEISGRARDGLDFLRVSNRVYSVADQFELLTSGLYEVFAGRAPSFPIRVRGLMGPDALPPATAITNLNGFALRDAVSDVYHFIQREGRVPARVFIGSEPIAPADFMTVMSAAWSVHRRSARNLTDETFPLPNGMRVLTERYIAKDTPGLFGGWIIHRADFRAPKLMELARLQAWTLKPATPREHP